jgi:hypothetical protein
MAAKYILAGLAVVFVVLGLARGVPSEPQSRAWLTVGAIFAVVSTWLFSRG